MIAVCSITASAQVINFRTTSYTYKQKNGYSWSNWAPYESSNMRITMNLNTDVVTIYSPKIQMYRVINYVGTYVDSDGDQVAEYKFIDQDGDRGTMRLMIRQNGKSEMYIQFANVIWVYTVIRI